MILKRLWLIASISMLAGLLEQSSLRSIRAINGFYSLYPTLAESCESKMHRVNNVAISQDSKYLLANWSEPAPEDVGKNSIEVWSNNSIRIWDLQTRHVISELRAPYLTDRTLFTLSPNNKYLVVEMKNGNAAVWDTFSSQQIYTFSRGITVSKPRIPEQIQGLSFSPDSKYILMLDTTAGILWNVETRTKMFEFETSHFEYPSIRFSPDGKKIIIEDRVWDTQTGQLLHQFDGLGNALFSPDGNYIFTEGITGAELWNSQTFAKIRTFDGIVNDEESYGWTFSSNSKYMASSEGQNAALIWDVKTGKIIYRFNLVYPQPEALFFNDSRRILLRERIYKETSDEVLYIFKTSYTIFDLEADRELRKIILDDNDPVDIIISPDDKYVITRADETASNFLSSILQVWDIKTGNILGEFC